VKSVINLAIGALAVTAVNGIALAQDSLVGRVYTFHSAAQSGCPAMDWHIVSLGNGELTGMISWNNMQDMAHVTGTYNSTARTFQFTAKETSGQGRTATATGEIRADGWLIADISGANVSCRRVTVPWQAYPGRAP
jgi:hypothetical protein